MVARLTRIALLAAAVIVLALAGCALDKTSIQDRISMFISDANAGNYSVLYKHLHTDCTQREAAKSPLFWNTTAFGPTETPVTLSVSYGTTTTGTIHCQVALDKAITFVMEEEETDNWFIRSIAVDTFLTIQ